MVQQWHMQAVVCEKAADAFAVLSNASIDVVLLDIELLGTSGKVLAEELHSLYPDIPLVLSYPLNYASSNLLEGSAFRISRPIHPRRLREGLAHLLNTGVGDQIQRME